MTTNRVDVLSVLRVAEGYCAYSGAQTSARNVKEAREAVAELIEAATKAVGDDGGVRYAGYYDDAGDHACCLTPSYEPHADDCWVPHLRAALARVKGEQA